MNLEESIKDVIQTKLSDGTIERIISEKLEKGINDAMNDLFSSYGNVGKVIKEKATEVLIPAIERHDFSDHIVKLDTVLTDIVNNTSLVENQKLLENFRELMIEDEDKKVIKTSELFERYCKYVAANVETNGLDVNTDDGEPTYESVHCSMEFEKEEGRSWSDFEKANIVFECEEDENMNFIIHVSRWQKYDNEKWTIDYKSNPTITSLRYMSDFEVFITKLNRCFCKVVVDDYEEEDWVTPEAEPEASFY